MVEEYATYLPPGWTGEKLEFHSPDDIAALSEEDADKLSKRQQHVYNQTPNLGYLESLPKLVEENNTTTIHEYGRKSAGVAEGVRIYKRSIAPLVQVVSLQQYSPFGYTPFRTSYANQTLWESFIKSFQGIIDVHLDDSFTHGEEMKLVKDEWEVQLVDDSDAEGASFEDCRAWFSEMRKDGIVEPGWDVGAFLMVDEEVMKTMVEFDGGEVPFVWAVDAGFEEVEGEKRYPAGYEGVIKVRIFALVHELYVALGSGVMSPLEVWGLTQSFKKRKGGHDEL